VSAGSGTADWVVVGFDKAVTAATIDLYETYQMGCVTEVIVIDRGGERDQHLERNRPDSSDDGGDVDSSRLFAVPVPSSIKSVQRVKIHVDSTGKGSWACLDAVGLTTSTGKNHLGHVIVPVAASMGAAA